jgi:pimeloyl-ACP methyl ester carboxylesterase
LVFDFADDKTCVHRNPKALVIGPYPSLDDAEIDVCVNTLVLWNGTCMSQPLGEYAAGCKIPVTYMHAARDLTVPMDDREVSVEQMRSQGVKVRRVMVETGHCPNLTAIKEVVENVKKLADEVEETEWS